MGRKAVRVIGIGLAVVAGVLGLGYLGLRLYLSSDGAKRLAADQIAAKLGGPVRVTRLDTGAAATAVHIEVLGQPQSAGPPPEPLLAGTVRVNVSPLGLAAGRMPTLVTVDRAKVTLRFDKDGNPKDKLPEPKAGGGDGPIPEVRVTDASVHIIQDGKPDFRLGGVNLSLTDTGGRLKVTGTAADPTWKNWTATADWARDGSAGSVEADTVAPVPVTQAMLDAVPFVPPSTWEAVKLNGTTPCKLRVALGADKKVTYKVELAPTGTELTVVPAGNLVLTDTAGKVTAEGSRVTLTGVTGRTADGEVAVDSDMDFGPDPAPLQFKVKARRLDVKKVPPRWGLGRFVDEGRLRGDATVTLLLKAGGKVEPRGDGRGVIEDAVILGGKGEVEVRLASDENGLRFDTMMPGANRGRPGPTTCGLYAHACAPRPEDRGGEPHGSSNLLGLRGDAAVALLATLLAQPPAPPKGSPDPNAKKPAETQYVQANLRLRDVDLAELVKRLKVDIPIRLTGKVSLEVNAEIPTNEARTLRAYRIRGKLSSPQLGIQDLVILQATTEVEFRDGVLTLTRLGGEIPVPGGPPGTFVGTARYGVDPRTDLSADLTLTRVPLGEVFKAAPGLAGVAAGAVSGRVTFKAPGDKLADVASYVADGTLTSDAVTVRGRRAEGVRIDLALRNNVARIANAKAVVEGLPVTANAAITLAGQYPFEARVRTEPADVVALRKLVPEAELPVDVAGRLEATADLNGTASPLTYKAAGTAKAANLRVGTAAVDSLSFNWALDPDAVTVSDLRAGVYNGTVTGSARYPFKADAAGEFGVRFDKVDAAVLSRAVPSSPVKLEGAVSGKLDGKLPPAPPGGSRQVEGDLKLDAPRLRVQGIDATDLGGTVKYEPGQIKYDLTAGALGGRVEVSGSYPLGQQPAPAAPPAGNPQALSGRLRVTGVDLGRLGRELKVRNLEPLRGVATVTLDYRFNPAGEPAGDGRVEVANLGWGRAAGSRLQAGLRVTPKAVELTDLSGRFADGSLRGRARYGLGQGVRTYFVLTLDGADAGQLLAPVGGPKLDARVTVTARGTVGRDVRGSGTLSVSRGKVSGFDLADVRVPYDFYYLPAAGGQVAVRDATGQAAGGRVTGDATLAFGTSIQLNGRVRFVDLSARALLGGVGQSSGLGAARMNGLFNFSGADVRGVDDLAGQLTATLGEGPVLDLPVFSQLSQVLVPSVSARGLVSFQGGDLRARLARGQVRIERLALTGPQSKLYAEGTVGLNRRLDLDVVAQTGQVGPNTRVLRAVGLRIPAAGPIPVALIVQATELLSNRTVRAQVTGTTDQPVVRVNAARLLSESAIRFLLAQYVPGLPLPDLIPTPNQ